MCGKDDGIAQVCETASSASKKGDREGHLDLLRRGSGQRTKRQDTLINELQGVMKEKLRELRPEGTKEKI